MSAVMGLLLWESPGLWLGLGFSFWEHDTWDVQQEGLGSSQTSAWAVTDIIPQAWGDQCPTAKGKGEARQLLLSLWGQQGPSPPGITASESRFPPVLSVDSAVLLLGETCDLLKYIN